MYHKIVAIRGRIYVAIGIPMQNAPILTINCYPTNLSARDNSEIIGNEGQEGVMALGDGRYMCPCYGSWRSTITFMLCHMGSTRPAYATSVNIPRPKTKVECKYRDGCWYKMLKKGRQSCGIDFKSLMTADDYSPVNIDLWQHAEA